MSQQEEIQVPEEFSKVIGDFVNDIQRTFPEYTPLISKWWKDDSKFSHIDDVEERQQQISQHKDKRVVFLYKFAMKKCRYSFKFMKFKT